jgi:molecular chaperone DnaK (HSP70)
MTTVNQRTLAVGIDLGTTNTVVGIQTDATGPRLLPVPQPVDHRQVLDPLLSLRSAVFFETPTSAMVGALAATRLEAYKSIKSKMGTRWRVPHPHQPDAFVTPAYISAHILKAAFDAVRRQFSEWDGSAIITVPASFNTDQRSDTLFAAQLAGFSQIRLLDEPTAAFYYYFDQGRDDIVDARPQTVLVFDFGGGTLDVSIIRVTHLSDAVSIDPIGRSRYNNLGGDDIDLDLASFLLALWERRNAVSLADSPAQLRKELARLFIQRASAFKEEAEYYIAQGRPLNEFRLEEHISGVGYARDVALSCELTREQYEELTGRLFSNKSDINIFKPIDQALQVAKQIAPGFSEDEIDLVLYTGGASRMAAVKAALGNRFDSRPCVSINDEEACNTVALGAATCRYDELYRGRSVQMSARLLESVLTRTNDGSAYVPLVPLTCVPSEQFTSVDKEFTTPRHLLRLRVPLFRGVGPHDHQLSPMGDLVLEFDEVVEGMTPYSFEYRMTPNKTLELRALLRPTGRPPLDAVGRIQLETGVDAPDETAALASVNKTS